MDDLLQEMIDPAPAPKDAPRRRRLWMTVVIVGLAAVGATRLTTAALFTDNASTVSAITSGTIDINATATAFTLPAGGMQPGDSVVAPIQVQNSGSLAQWYAVTYAATDTDTVSSGPGADPGPVHLSERLRLEVFTGGAACTVPADTTGATRIALVTGLSQAESALFGDRATEAPTPNTNRTLAATTSEDLCVKVTFDGGSPDDNVYQGTGTDITLRFYATQVTRS